jgi:hypothetical protein
MKDQIIKQLHYNISLNRGHILMQKILKLFIIYILLMPNLHP